MNNQNELIKRIDALLALRVESSATSTINNDCPLDPNVEKALSDCRAEIVSLSERLKESQALCLKFSQDRETTDDTIERLEARIAELEKPYVPMTRDEWEKLMDSYSDEHNTPWRRYIEAAVIKRYNEQRGVE